MVPLHKLFVAISFITTSGFAYADYTSIHPDSSDKKEIKDTLTPFEDLRETARLDSAIYCFYEELIAINQPIGHPHELRISDSIPVFSSEVYRKRLELLDQTTPFDLTYNSTVEAFIHLYISKKRPLSSSAIARSQLYFPMIEEALDRYGLPLELKYLAVVESALNPTVRSRAGATGLWQFMYGTAKVFGLKIDSYIDERCDPQRSTEAACKYLQHLYNLFGDWNLALAAYNCGEGRVARAIRRAGGQKDYWAIYPYLPRETRGYVPAFIAVNYLFAHAHEHLITADEQITWNHLDIDTVHVKSPVTFQLVSEILNLDESVIRYLNPVYRAEYIPAYGSFNVLRLPKSSIGVWVSNETAIRKIIADEMAQSQPDPVPQPVYYTVRSGDYLGKIANQHGCTVRQLQQWNNLSGTTLQIGQRLAIYPANQTISVEKKQPVEQIGEHIYYTIQSGDTLWEIAKSRGVTLNEIKSWNHQIDFNRVKPGQKIIVGVSAHGA
ncbi:MAG: hypothetical protein Kow0075_05410 [Salibacteraceae bacterium]